MQSWCIRVDFIFPTSDLELSHLVFLHTNAAISEGTKIAIIQSHH